MKLVAKAIVGSITAVLGALISATSDSSGITLNELLIAVSAGVAALGLIYFVPNSEGGN